MFTKQTHQHTVREIRQLLNARSFTTEQWRAITRQAGAHTGVLTDMTAPQLNELHDLILAQPERKGKQKVG